MLAGTETLATIANHWFARFEHALSQRDTQSLANLFHRDGHWRDVLAFTWRIGTVSGAHAIAAALQEHARRARPGGFRTDPERTAPRHVTRAGAKCVEVIYRFETALGRGSGVLRFFPDEEEPRAWTLLTSLDELKKFEEHVGRRRPDGWGYSRDFAGPNWLDLRTSSRSYSEREPTVLVVGGGQAGLTTAARLGQLGVDTLIVDRWPRVGDNWRRRYHALTLHNQVHVNHLPYMPFPPNWPVYIPKDKLANWFESYAEAMELNYWTGAEFEGGSYDARDERWSVTVRREDGSKRELHPRHVVLATGVSGIPNIPEISALKNFEGRILHSSQYEDGEAWKGKRAIVIGTGNSGHDIAQDLYSAGAKVTIVQRSPTLITNCDPSAQLVYSLYSEGPPLEDCDLITASIPLKISRESHKLATQHAKNLDKALLDRLEQKGFRLCDGEDGTGWQFLYLTRGGGYYFNVGCSDLIADGRIGLAQFDELEELLKEADLVVLATGWKGQEHLVARLFGAGMAARVGPIWGFGEGQELRNMFQRTPQPGLWFIAGSFAQCRIYSKYLALQIKATEAGVIDR
ncbi:MAG TPA: NAD(P)-binding domain-containing protein [Burkholderiales bacterium]|jgi:putative flavoprotein involved in K+ transport|nr:NAD(P)-binding domain-containing protein [Burkholderiales bacterium]